MTPHEFTRSGAYQFCDSVERGGEFAGWALYDPEARHPDFWSVLREEWPSFDALAHDCFRRVLALHRQTWKQEADCPDRMKVYRGEPHGMLTGSLVTKGLSWTTDREVAESFARGHRGVTPTYPLVWQAEVTRDDIAFTTNERGESEVVLFNPRFDALSGPDDDGQRFKLLGWPADAVEIQRRQLARLEAQVTKLLALTKESEPDLHILIRDRREVLTITRPNRRLPLTEREIAEGAREVRAKRSAARTKKPT
ncbi:hypothetical protein PAF17_19360 [Paracoccus sp. Z330]|uniref:Uncharacterized protein n=1 Tax=Paracoccus onchidii TaxID=3017813 RepID=A0ABT4ZLL3_9RHOB|nr:hypothetical protein [Paracoccus onchidii]MDB6179625.1 hypothetical protein [Paracoccus onchidii]